MEYVALFATIIALLVFIHQRDQQQQEERKDLLDRIMSRNFVEYKEQTAAPVKYEPVSVSEQSEYWREIEEQRMN